MNKLLPALLAAAVLAGCDQWNPGAGDEGATADVPRDLQDETARRSYAIGMNIGQSLQDAPVELQREHLIRGLTDAMEGRETLLTEEQQRAAMQEFMTDLEIARRERAAAEAEENKREGDTFLAENKTREGVEVTDSGLQYEVLEPGEGESPDADDRVTVHYEGRLIDDTVFDSSIERGEPVTFPVDAVIPGWSEALQLMKEGAEYRLFVPPDLAYGERGAGADIGPHETLIFDVRLIEVVEEESEENG